MSELDSERLLETCCRNDGADILLVPGKPPFIRMKDFWRPLDAPLIELEEINSMAHERFRAGTGLLDECTYADFWYRDVAMFRALAFGYPATTLLIFARIQPPAPPANPAIPSIP